MAANQENKNSTSCDSYCLGENFEMPKSNTQNIEENYKENELANFPTIGQTDMNLNLEQQPATQKQKLLLEKIIQTIDKSH